MAAIQSQGNNTLPDAAKDEGFFRDTWHDYTAIIDQELNDKGYIVPGLGDAGDRSFGTGA